MKLEFGFQFANMEPARMRDLAQAAEALDYDYIVFPDHIVLEGPERQQDPHALAWDMVSMAAWLAGATKKIRIGHLVLCNLFRHPAITAQSLTTIDHLSNGRLLAGLGSGWTQTEFRDDRDPVSSDRRAAADAGRGADLIKSLWANEQSHFRRRVLPSEGCDSVAQADPAAVPADHRRRGRQGPAAHRGEARRLRQHHSRRGQARAHFASPS